MGDGGRVPKPRNWVQESCPQTWFLAPRLQILPLLFRWTVGRGIAKPGARESGSGKLPPDLVPSPWASNATPRVLVESGDGDYKAMGAKEALSCRVAISQFTALWALNASYATQLGSMHCNLKPRELGHS